MAAFTCEARDASGGLVRRTVDAASESEALLLLEREGLFPVEISPALPADADSREGAAARPRKRRRSVLAPAPAARDGGRRVDRRFRGKELLNFTIQLGSSLGAGVPILAALESIAKQAPNPFAEAIFCQMHADIDGGLALSAAMRNHPKAFSEVYCSTVAAGEQSGTLDEVLANLAEFVETDLDVRSDVRSALLYPAIVIATLTIAIGVLVVFVVPRFASFYSGFDAELPLPTRILIGGSTLLTDNAVAALVALAALAFGFARAIGTASGRRALDGFLRRVPVVSRMLDVARTLHVTQMLELFTRAGIPILQGLETITTTVSSAHLREKLDAVAEHVAAGSSLADGLEAADCLPPTARQMIASGQSAGTLEVSCAAVTAQYKKELRSFTKNLATLIEPFLTLVLAIVVLFVALAVFLPMWDIVHVVRT